MGDGVLKMLDRQQGGSEQPLSKLRHGLLDSQQLACLSQFNPCQY